MNEPTQLNKGDRAIKVIKRHQPDSDFIESHELSLLSLLVRKHPERAKEFIRRLSESMKATA
jgi:hypothetical protein